MDPNNLTNIGTDLSVWVQLTVTVILIGLIFLGYYWAYLPYKKLKEKGVKQTLIRGIVVSGVLFALLWIIFGAYGAGSPPQITPPEYDGFAQQVQKMPDEPTSQEIKEAGRDKLPSELRKVEEKAEEGKNEDEYIRKAIERSKKMLEN
jgi:hypothetical protein